MVTIEKTNSSMAMLHIGLGSISMLLATKTVWLAGLFLMVHAGCGWLLNRHLQPLTGTESRRLVGVSLFISMTMVLAGWASNPEWAALILVAAFSLDASHCLVTLHKESMGIAVTSDEV